MTALQKARTANEIQAAVDQLGSTMVAPINTSVSEKIIITLLFAILRNLEALAKGQRWS